MKNYLFALALLSLGALADSTLENHPIVGTFAVVQYERVDGDEILSSVLEIKDDGRVLYIIPELDTICEGTAKFLPTHVAANQLSIDLDCYDMGPEEKGEIKLQMVINLKRVKDFDHFFPPVTVTISGKTDYGKAGEMEFTRQQN